MKQDCKDLYAINHNREGKVGETEEEVEEVPFYRLPMVGMDPGGRIEAGRWRRRPCSGRTATGPS